MSELIRSYFDVYALESLTERINQMPNRWNTINQLGIFPTTPEGVITDSVAVDLIEYNTPLIKDMIRGVRPQYGKDNKRSKKTFAIPHYPIDDVVTAKDIKNRVGFGKDSAPDTVADAVFRKLETLRRGHAQLRETQRSQILLDGTCYSPNGTVSLNFYTEFGITRKEIDFVLGTATTDVKGKAEEGIAHIYDNLLNGTDTISGFIALCSPTFFARLTSHAKVTTAYLNFSSVGGDKLLRDRLSSNLPMGVRVFDYAGIIWVEMRDKLPDGSAMMTDGEARLVPVGAFDIFRCYASPSEKMSDVNTIGRELYAYQYMMPKDEGIEIQTESNVLNVVTRPQCIVRLYSSN